EAGHEAPHLADRWRRRAEIEVPYRLTAHPTLPWRLLTAGQAVLLGDVRSVHQLVCWRLPQTSLLELAARGDGVGRVAGWRVYGDHPPQIAVAGLARPDVEDGALPG